jgi:hypothetical protein
MTPEKAIELAACRRARSELGVESVKFTPAGSNGWPDRQFWVPGGRPMLIEFKAPGERLDPLQVHRHEQLKGWGYDVITCWTDDEAVGAVRRALRRALR